MSNAMSGLVGGQYVPALTEAMFGSSRLAAMPSSLTLYLGKANAGGTYSATVTVANDSTHWSYIPGAGIANAVDLTFSGLTSGDVTAWDSTGMSVYLYDAASSNILAVAEWGSPPSITPTVGLAITIGANKLVFRFVYTQTLA